MSAVRVASLLDAAREAWLPGLCCSCGIPLRGGDRGLCAVCWSHINPIAGVLCPRCGGDSDREGEPCLSCSDSPPPQLATVVWGEYEGTLRAAVVASKHGGHDELARPLARRLAARVSVEGWVASLETVVAVPSHPAHRLRRAFALAPLLAAGVAKELGLRHRRPLSRRGLGRQAGRSRADRLRLGRRSFSARRRPPPGGILLVDDVTTTGATLRRATEALLAAGAGTVYCAVLARAPDPRRLP
jgi:predicted amidophosphoribosyltransferase